MSFKGHKHSEETIRKISISNKVFFSNQELRDKISKKSTGIVYKSIQTIDPNSPQAKIWPEIIGSHCWICRTYKVTRRKAIQKFGSIKGQCVCHKCDNIFGRCCNPDHLFLGTRKDNQQDMVKKGRSNKGKKFPITEERKTGLIEFYKTHKHSPEAIKKMSDASKAYWSKRKKSDSVDPDCT